MVIAGISVGDRVHRKNGANLGIVRSVQHQPGEFGDYALVEVDSLLVSLTNTINFNSVQVRVTGRVAEPAPRKLLIRTGSMNGGNYQFVVVDAIGLTANGLRGISSAYHFMGTRPVTGDSGGAILEQTNNGNNHSFAGVFSGDDANHIYYTPPRYVVGFIPFT